MAIDVSLSRKISRLSLWCALMVVGVHLGGGGDSGCVVWWLQESLGFGLFAIAVPFFFVISGYFVGVAYARGDGYRKILGKRVWTLLIPFVIWNLVYAAFELGLISANDVLHGRAVGSNISLSGWRWFSLVGLYPFSEPFLGPLWYVRGLFLIVILSPVLRSLVEGRGRHVCLALLFLVMYMTMSIFPPESKWYHFWRWTVPTLGLFYFSVGMYLRKYPIPDQWGRTVAKVLFPLGVLLLTAELYCKASAVPAPIYFRALMIPCVLVGVWYITPSTTLPRALMGMAFPIYVLHYIFISFVFFLNHDSTSLFWYLMRGLVGVLGPITVAWMMRRYVPRVAAIVFGGR